MESKLNNSLNRTAETNSDKSRSSNLELFRIITMFLIIAHHYVVNSGLLAEGAPILENLLTGKSIFLLLFGGWGKTGINCFVLITGYFMCKSNITVKKFFKLFFEIMFYKIIIYLTFLITGYEAFSIKTLVKAVLPFTTVAQGFVGTFLIFYLCIPFLNILVNNMNEKQHIRLLLVLFFTYVLFGTVPFFTVEMNYVSWFCVLYFVSSYIRLYPKKIFDNTKFWGVLSLISILIAASSILVCIWLSSKMGKNVIYYFVTDSNTFLALLVGVSSFMFFKNLNLKNSKFINTVAASCFGVLLIHAGGGHDATLALERYTQQCRNV